MAKVTEHTELKVDTNGVVVVPIQYNEMNPAGTFIPPTILQIFNEEDIAPIYQYNGDMQYGVMLRYQLPNGFVYWVLFIDCIENKVLSEKQLCDGIDRFNDIVEQNGQFNTVFYLAIDIVNDLQNEYEWFETEIYNYIEASKSSYTVRLVYNDN
jgi:hypothetical protein